MSELVNEIASLISTLTFWLQVGGGFLIWYIVAVLIAHITFRPGRDPFSPARIGVVFALFLVPILTAIVTWFWEEKLSLTLATALLIFLLALIVTIIISRREPARTKG
jgi:hypothetical protein